MRRLKAQPGKEIGVGGPNRARSFMIDGLIDEFRFMITPVAIGEGTPVFRGLERRPRLGLTETLKLSSGNTLLCYKPR